MFQVCDGVSIERLPDGSVRLKFGPSFGTLLGEPGDSEVTIRRSEWIAAIVAVGEPSLLPEERDGRAWALHMATAGGV